MFEYPQQSLTWLHALDTGDLDDPDFQTFLSHWESLKQGSEPPKRAHFNPLTIAQLLDRVVLVQKKDSRYYVSLAGDTVQWDGISLSGEPIDTRIFGELAHELTTMYDHVANTLTPAFFAGEARSGRKKGQCFRQLTLPYLDNAGEPTQFVSMVVYDLVRNR